MNWVNQVNQVNQVKSGEGAFVDLVHESSFCAYAANGAIC